MGDDEAAGASKGTPSKAKGKGTDTGVGMMGIIGPQSFLTLGAASKVDLVADFRGGKQDPAKEGGAGPSDGGAPQLASKAVMPEGVQLVGGEAILQEQEDGSQARAECTALHAL